MAFVGADGVLNDTINGGNEIQHVENIMTMLTFIEDAAKMIGNHRSETPSDIKLTKINNETAAALKLAKSISSEACAELKLSVEWLAKSGQTQNAITALEMVCELNTLTTKCQDFVIIRGMAGEGIHSISGRMNGGIKTGAPSIVDKKQINMPKVFA